ELGERWRIATEAERTGDELGALLGDFFDYAVLDGIVLSSTVPRLIREYEHLAERWAKVPLLVIGPGVKVGIRLQHDSPREIGPDRIVNGAAGEGEVRGPPPGVEAWLGALPARGAGLVKADFVEPPAPIGKSTATALQSGLVYG